MGLETDTGGGAASVITGADTTTDTTTTTADTTATTTATDTNATTTATTAEPEWLQSISAEGGDADNPSNRDWVKSLGVKDLDGLAKIARDNQKAARGKLTVPGENATPEEVAAYRAAIGVPDKPEGYEFALPEGVTEDMLDQDLIGPLREQALAAGVPAAGFKALAEGVVKNQLEELAAYERGENDDRDAKLREWGKDKDQKLADVNAAARALGLTRSDLAGMQRGLALAAGGKDGRGSGRMLDILQKLGAGMAEDALIGGGGARRFGVTGPEAQAEIDKLRADPDFSAKLFAKDPAAETRWNTLNAAVAAHRDQEEKRAAAG